MSSNSSSPPASLYTTAVRRAFVILTVVPAAVQTVLCLVVLYMALRTRAYRKSRNLLVVAAAAIDLIRGVHSFFSPALFYDPLESSATNERVCIAYAWVHYFQYCMSTWTIAAIAFSRYDMISRPFRRRLTMKWVLLLICLIVVEGAIFASLPLMGWNDYGLKKLPGSDFYRCAVADPNIDQAFVPVHYGINYALPLLVIIVSYLLIVPIALRVGRKQERDAQYKAPPNAGRRESVQFAAVRVAKKVSKIIHSKPFRYVTVIVATNIILTIPFAVAEITRYYKGKAVSDLLLPITKFIFNINFVVNALFYLLWVRMFLSDRDGRRRFCCKCCYVSDSEQVFSSTSDAASNRRRSSAGSAIGLQEAPLNAKPLPTIDEDTDAA